MERVLDILLIGYLISLACVILVVLLVFIERGGPPHDPGQEAIERQLSLIRQRDLTERLASDT